MGLVVAALAGLIVGWAAHHLATRPRPEPEPAPEPKVELPGPEWIPEPWRVTSPDAVLVSIDVLHLVAIPEDLRRAVNDQARSDKLFGLLAEQGCRTPLELVHDLHGRVVLGDGHNRLVAGSRLGWSALPVVFKGSPRITGYARPAKIFMAALARTAPHPRAVAAPRTAESTTPAEPPSRSAPGPS